ncbi:MAG TPA: MATE family efflux transporter [Bryobacteraceae bacterium]|jgi:MATE family multidrug resistance protein|nr:MATE family efflux transporter [Bryobacteraceae bacterium]
MSLALADLKREFRPMLRLAAPLAAAEVGGMVMGIVDTIMAGPLGPAAVGAGILGNMIFYPLASSFIGMLLGMDTLVAQSHGAGDPRDCRRTLINGFWLGLLITPLIAGLILAALPIIAASGANPRVMEQCTPYAHALLWGIPAFMLATAFRRYLQAVDIVHPITFALVSANAVNVAGDWALMYGHLGARAMGLAGSGWSTSLSRLYMMLVLGGAVVWNERRTGGLLFRMSWRPDLARLRRLIALGLPATGQIAFEGAVFGVVTVLAARLDAVSLAAHGIAVQVIATTFMVPLGISSAAAVRVGQAMGRKDARGVAAAGWAALLLSSLFMGAAGVALWTVPRWIVRVFIADAAVIASGAVLLRIAAFFELFDGLQIVATGALRGVGDTRTPMIAHLIGYWVIGMPVAYALCFRFGWGAPGIWVGLSAALILIGAALVWVWRSAALKNSRERSYTPYSRESSGSSPIN